MFRLLHCHPFFSIHENRIAKKFYAIGETKTGNIGIYETLRDGELDFIAGEIGGLSASNSQTQER